MKTTIDWVLNLLELGTPIRSRVMQAKSDLETAKERFRVAEAALREANDEFQREAGKIEAHVATLWTKEEIKAAKKGCFLINGVEYPISR